MKSSWRLGGGVWAACTGSTGRFAWSSSAAPHTAATAHNRIRGRRLFMFACWRDLPRRRGAGRRPHSSPSIAASPATLAARLDAGQAWASRPAAGGVAIGHALEEGLVAAGERVDPFRVDLREQPIEPGRVLLAGLALAHRLARLPGDRGVPPDPALSRGDEAPRRAGEVHDVRGRAAAAEEDV